MGQRLNITIAKDGKRLANAYYHWSAYTTESARMAKELIDFIRKPELMSDKDKLDIIFSVGTKDLADYPDLTDLEKAIFLLNYTGSGFPQYEITRIIEEARKGTLPQIRGFLLKPSEGRNAGLTSITEAGMDETEDWEEGRVTIDIGTNRVNFDNFFYRDLEEYDEEEIAKFNAIPRIQCNFHFDNMTFDEFDWFYEKVTFHDDLSDARDGEEYIYIDQSGNQCECIY